MARFSQTYNSHHIAGPSRQDVGYNLWVRSLIFDLFSIFVIAVLHAMSFCSCELDPMKCNFVEIWINNIWISSCTKISCGFYISGEGMLVHCTVCWHFTVDIRLHYRLGNTQQYSIKTMNASNNTSAIFWIQPSCVLHVSIICIMSLEAVSYGGITGIIISDEVL